MTGTKGSELAELRVEHPFTLEFYEMVCREMLIARTSGPLNLTDIPQITSRFVEIVPPYHHRGKRIFSAAI
jgi:hypothetical protein